MAHKVLIYTILIMFSFVFIVNAYAVGWHFAIPVNIKDGMKIHFGDSWISTVGTSIKITEWFDDDWLNYTVSNSATQEINHEDAKPNRVYVDGALKDEGNMWTYTARVTTVEGATLNVSLYYAGSPTTYATKGFVLAAIMLLLLIGLPIVVLLWRRK